MLCKTTYYTCGILKNNMKESFFDILKKSIITNGNISEILIFATGFVNYGFKTNIQHNKD